MDYFIDKTCTISDVLIVNVDGEDTKSYTPVYTSIPCDFYHSKGQIGYKSGQQARETDYMQYEVVLLGNKNLCGKGQKISIVDNNANDLGNYLVEDVAFYPDISGEIDNTTLFVTQRDAG